MTSAPAMRRDLEFREWASAIPATNFLDVKNDK
jgi:hypothetical protein